MQNNLTKSELRNKIENLEKYFSKYKKQDVVKKLEEVKEKLNNQEYKIAVVANMSAGKSTFINALFGKEVLPAFNHATTDSATYIYSKPNIEKKAQIFFSDGKKSITVTQDVEKEIKQYAQKDKDCEDDKYKNVERVELYYPFEHLQTSSSEDFSITFIDTPGPNSTGDYGQKHKDQTRSVLNSVDMALFTFDYGQLDANLKSDEQGLWNTIKKRCEKDKNFEVYFLINKIDMAMEDNFTNIDTKNKEEFIKLKKENWLIHENKAIVKLEEAIKYHNIKEPKIYTISSIFQLLTRDANKNWDDEDKLTDFQKKHFIRLFEHNWEEKFIDYLGVLKLENDINTYINTSVKDKILKNLNSKIIEIKLEEQLQLEQKIKVLQQPKEEAENNLKDATEFLNGSANEMEKEFKEKSYDIQKQYIELIKKVITDNIENELKKNTKEATNRTIKFLELILEDYSIIDATSDAKNLPLEQIKDNLYKSSLSITIKHEFEVIEIEKNLQNFIVSILNDYKNNYLDMKIDIKNNYFEMSDKISDLFNEYKLEFNKKLKNTLNIGDIALDENTLYSKSNFNEELKIPDSTIEYKYQSEEWADKGSFSGREKVKDEEHKILIVPENIKKIFDLSIDSIKRTYLNKEIKTYEDTIVNFIQLYQGKFNDFKHAKKQEIRQIEKDLENSKQNLEKALAQYKEFDKMKKDI